MRAEGARFRVAVLPLCVAVCCWGTDGVLGGAGACSSFVVWLWWLPLAVRSIGHEWCVGCTLSFDRVLGCAGLCPQFCFCQTSSAVCFFFALGVQWVFASTEDREHCVCQTAAAFRLALFPSSVVSLEKKSSAMPKENALLASSTVEAGSALRVPTVDSTATMPRH